MNATYTAYVATDLYNAGYTEDGQPFVAEVYYVYLENVEGRRFSHTSSFRGAERLTDDEGINHFVDCREEAFAKADQELPFAVSARHSSCDVRDTFEDEIHPST